MRFYEVINLFAKLRKSIGLLQMQWETHEKEVSSFLGC